MAAKLEKRTHNPNFKDPAWYTALAVDFIDLKIGSAAKTLSKGLNSETSDPAKELAYIFIQAFNQCRIVKGDNVTYENKFDFLFTEQQLDPDFPTHHRLFHILLTEIKDKKLNKGDYSLDDSWITDLRYEFSAEFNEIIRLERDKFKAATSYIQDLKQSPPTEAKIIQHTNDVIYEVEHDPIAIDHQLTLHKSYVSPNCTSELVAIPSRKDTKANKARSNCLIRTLVDNLDNEVLPIVVHGQPGHGKTSSVKVLVRTMVGLYREVESPPLILLFELKHLGNLNRPLVDILHQKAPFINSLDFFQEKQVILIFDGLDERQVTDGTNDQFLKEFVSNLFDLSTDINKKQDSRLNLIFTGRSQYVGQIKSCFTSTHLAIDICDFDENKQKFWLKSFNEQKNLDDTNKLTLDKLKRFNLNELLSQPILLTISSIMLTDVDGKQIIEKYVHTQINRSEIYRTIIKWSYEKRWTKSARVESWKDTLSFDDYFKLLQAMAFEISRLGEETIKLSSLVTSLKENSIKIFDLDVIDNMDLKSLENLCSQLRVSFFFQGVEEKAFSFIHKSIKDFLYATGLIDAAPIIFDEYSCRKPENTDTDLIALYGNTPLSKGDHFTFLSQWIESKKTDFAQYISCSYDIWKRLETFEIVIKEDNYVIQQKQLANTIYNYLQIISRWYPLLTNIQTQKTFNQEYVALFTPLSFLRVRNLFTNNYLSHTYYVKQNLNGIKFNGDNYEYIDFSGSNLKDCEYTGTVFYNCNFSNTTELRVDFMITFFLDCHFSNVKFIIARDDVYSSIFTDCSFVNTELVCLPESISSIHFRNCSGLENQNVPDQLKRVIRGRHNVYKN